jgi:serine/threonine protein phosphatase PrpC
VGTPRRQQRARVEADLGDLAGVSERGSVRASNQDAVHIVRQGEVRIAVVADGVSSTRGADAAAEVAVTAAARHVAEGAALAPWDATQAVRGAVRDARDATVQLAARQPAGHEAPSCTIVAAAWDGETIAVAWAGDSRAYWLGADGTTAALTIDHSWAQEQVDGGMMSAAEAEADGRAHVITRWVGADLPEMEPDAVAFVPASSGRLVLCTDGLWNYAPTPSELAALAACAVGGPLAQARGLVAAALARGGRDNVTVAVVDVVPADPAQERDE